MGLQGVTRSYKGLKRVTRATGDDNGLHGVTRGYRGL